MRLQKFGCQVSTAALAVGLVFCAGGCYGTPRTAVPDAGSGGTSGSGGANGGGPADLYDAAIDNNPDGCACPGPTTGPTTGVGVCASGACRISCDSTYPTLCAAVNACVDLMSDGKNCGTCGHHCLGGSCAAGQCQPVMIAQYFGHPMIIYVGAQAVYVTTDLGYVGRANKSGSDLMPLAMPGFASSAFIGTLVAEDGDRVFLVRYDGSATRLSYCATSGCDSTAIPVGERYTQYFAVDQPDHKIVWVDYAPARFVSSSTVATVSGVDLPGGSLASESSISRLFYSQGGIYFTVNGGTSINRIPINGGSIATVTGGTAPLSILGANGKSLFLYDGTAIGTVPLPNGDGRGPKALIGFAALNVSMDGHFAADENAIYWAVNGQAYTCEISDCPGTQKMLPKRAADSVWDIGIDDAAIYFLAESGDANNPAVSTAWKLAK
jgi:hypothetical protein